MTIYEKHRKQNRMKYEQRILTSQFRKDPVGIVIECFNLLINLKSLNEARSLFI